MRTTATPTMLTTSERVYQLLLWLYPSDYRREYGADMMQLFRDLRRDALRERGAAGLIDLWMHVIIDFAVSILADGSAVIVHAAADNFGNIPVDRYDPDPDEATLNTGDAGGRVGCGLVEGAGS